VEEGKLKLLPSWSSAGTPPIYVNNMSTGVWINKPLRKLTHEYLKEKDFRDQGVMSIWN